ncbi:MAG: hypothetical protein F4044_10245, partial [Rhodobacteraceae bacterium]|nr:hypothetical protein [Paracoccaceae bacterium]
MSSTNLDSEKSLNKIDKVPLPRWDLGDLYEARDSKKLSEDIRLLDKVCEEFENKYQSKIETNKDAEFLYQSLQEYESIELRKNRIISYAYLLHQTNLNDPVISKFFGDSVARYKSWEAKLVFFENQLSQIPEATLKVMLENSTDLERYGHYLASCQKFKPHVLSLELEKYSKDSSILKSSWLRLFDTTISSIKCQVGNKA